MATTCITRCVRSCFCCRQQEAEPAPPPPAITIDRVRGWITQADQEIPLVTSLNSNGLYSLLNREITVMNNLLTESNALIAGVNLLTPEAVRTAINQSVSPKKAQLAQALAIAQQKVAGHRAEVESDEKLAKKWEDLKFPATVLERHADCARFLIESGLAFSIAGFRETRTGNSALHDLKLAEDGHPLIKVKGRGVVKGEWMRWEKLKTLVLFDPKTQQIRSRDYPGTLVESWTYLSQDGLVPIDRLTHDHLVPIYQLNPEEYQATLAFARRFYETNPEVDLGVAKDCVYQVVTTPSRNLCATQTIENLPINQNLIGNLNSHVIMRLILPNGDLYSFGLEMPAESQQFLFDGQQMATVPAKINKAGDYEEFRPFDERIVTGIPLTKARANGIIEMLNQMGDIRFQFMRQNCSNLMRTVLQEVGYQPVDNRMTAVEVLWGALPNAEHLPVIGPLIAKIQLVTTPIFNYISNLMPRCIKIAFSYISAVVWFIPGKIATFLVNVVQLYLGGAKMLYPLADDIEEAEFYDNRKIINFSRSIRSPWDLFREETSIAYHSKQITQWQKEQKSTFSETYSGCPKLVVVPPAAAAS